MQRAAHGASPRRRHGSATALLGEPMAAQRRRTGDGRGTGVSPAWGRRRERRGGRGGGPGDAASDRGGRDGGASGEAVGAAVWATRLQTAAVGTAARAARRAGGRCQVVGQRARGGTVGTCGALTR
jgi:hypothetical protein